MNAAIQAAFEETPRNRKAPDRRRFFRVPLTIGGRFLYDQKDHLLETVNLSCGSAALKSDIVPPTGTPLVLYFDDLGRVSATVTRTFESGFAVVFKTTPHKRDKIADRLVWLLNYKRYDLKDERSAPRKGGGGPALITRADGRKIQCRVLDISLTGAAFEMSGPIPPIGEIVRAGSIKGEVVRAVPEGFAIRFLHKPKAKAES